MKRLLSMLLLLTFLLPIGPAALSEAEPSKASVTIDGIRTAFFSSDGDYLPPLEKDGVVYVPALSLAESLQMNVTADADTLAVTLDGVRKAFFDDGGAYLPPMNAEGVVYVPLAAFAQSAGIPLTQEGDAYALLRHAPSTPAPTAAPTAVPTAAPTAAPQYANIELTLDNYSDYFDISQSCYIPDGFPSSFYVTFTAVIQATTSYGLNNVTFSLDKYGPVRVPSSGRATASYRTESIYGSSKDKDYILEVTRYKTNAHLSAIYIPSVTSVSGSIRMSYEEAQAIWEKEYSRAVGRMELVSTSSAFNDIIKTLQRLANENYKDSAEQVEIAREKQRDLKAKEDEAARAEQEKANQEAYEAAESALNSGKFQEAIDGFAALAKKGYKGSDPKQAEAQEALNDSIYQTAAERMEAGNYAAAIEGFAPLAKANYRDSADKLDEATEKDRAARYQAAQDAKKAGNYEEAQKLFEELGKDRYKDSAVMATMTAGEALMAQGKWKDAMDVLSAVDTGEAKTLYAQCRMRRANSVSAPTSAGTVWVEETLSNSKKSYYLINKYGTVLADNIPFADRSYYDDRGNRIANAYGNNTLSFYDYAYALVHHQNAYFLVDKQGNETPLSSKYDYVRMSSDHLICYRATVSKKLMYGCTDIAGKVVIKPSSTKEIMFQYGLAVVEKTTTKNNQKTAQLALINEKGKELIGFGKYDTLAILDANLILASKADKNGRQQFFLDSKGKVLKKLEGQNTFKRSGSYIIQKNEKNQFCLLDLQLNQVLPFRSGEIQAVINDNRIIAVKGSGAANTGRILCDMEGKTLTGDRVYSNMYAKPDSPFIAARRNGAWYLLDLNGNEIF